MTNSRVAAIKASLLVLEKGQSLPHALDNVLHDLKTADKAYCQELSYGILRFYHRYQAILNAWTAKPIKDTTVSVILASGFYQLEHMRTKKHAAVHETVELTKRFKKHWATKLVNALLRRWQNEETKHYQDKPQAVVERIHYAFPTWLIAAIKKAWPTHWQAILIAGNHKPPLELRVNLQKISKAQYCQQLRVNHIDYIDHDTPEESVTLKEAVNVDQIPGFQNGLVSVQAKGAQWAAKILAPKNGMNILDACAAPGGKTMHILALAPDAKVTAVDIDEQRLKRIEENCRRTQQKAQLIVGDIKTLAFEKASFDSILLDAPCSATGVIARHPDIKHLRRETDLKNLAKTQLQALQHVWPLLKPGGLLVYSTCSLMPIENDEVINAFFTSFDQVNEDKPILINITQPIGIPTHYGRQLLPDRYSTDGFYYAKLKKQNA